MDEVEVHSVPHKQAIAAASADDLVADSSLRSYLHAFLNVRNRYMTLGQIARVAHDAA